MKKHRDQMTDQEIKSVEDYVHARSFEINSIHVLEKMSEQKISPDSVSKAIGNGYIVEVSRKGIHPKSPISFLMRKTVNKKDVCVVVSSVGVIVTAWKMSPKDRHKNLDLSQYTWTDDLSSLIEGLK